MDWQIGTDKAVAAALNELAVIQSLVALDTTRESSETNHFPRKRQPPDPATHWDAAASEALWPSMNVFQTLCGSR